MEPTHEQAILVANLQKAYTSKDYQGLCTLINDNTEVYSIQVSVDVQPKRPGFINRGIPQAPRLNPGVSLNSDPNVMQSLISLGIPHHVAQRLASMNLTTEQAISYYNANSGQI